MISQKLQSVRGTKDLFGEEIDKFNHVIKIAKEVSQNYCFQELQTPIFEFSEIFERNLGEDSDILTKEVYKFKDRSDNFLTLRPEFTAAIVRSFVANGELSQVLPRKLFSYGPLFRYDRPQRGRQRQFHQINYEIFGGDNFYCDVEIVIMAQEITQKLAIDNNLDLKISHLGCQETKKQFALALQDYFCKYEQDLSDDSKMRLNKNPLRILDSKSEQDIKLFFDAPKIEKFYSKETKENFDDITNLLQKLGVKYHIESNLVRGLDYYTGLVFEFINDHQGAQNTVLAGGRYNNLVENMSGRAVSAIGFAAGVERLMLMLDFKNQEARPIIINYVSQEDKFFAFELVTKLRDKGFSVDFNFAGNFKRQMKKLSQKNYQFLIIIGENEIKNKELLIKNLDSGFEEKVTIDNLTNFFAKSYK